MQKKIVESSSIQENFPFTSQYAIHNLPQSRMSWLKTCYVYVLAQSLCCLRFGSMSSTYVQRSLNNFEPIDTVPLNALTYYTYIFYLISAQKSSSSAQQNLLNKNLLLSSRTMKSHYYRNFARHAASFMHPKNVHVHINT